MIIDPNTGLPASPVGSNVQAFITKVIELEETGSTNEDARKLAASGAPHGTLVRAEKQNGGKGRRGRNWQSPHGVNLYFSLLLRPTFAPDKASMLTLLMAVAVARSVKEVCGAGRKKNHRVEIKWPNDIVINRKKVCGILTEMETERDNICYVVTGVGINVNMKEIPVDLAENATSLMLEYKTEISRELLLGHILQNFEKEYLILEKNKNLAFVREEYNRHLTGMGEEVRILDPKGEFAGISHGITEMGELLVEKKDNSPESGMVKVYAGEVSVRGINGYV